MCSNDRLWVLKFLDAHGNITQKNSETGKATLSSLWLSQNNSGLLGRKTFFD